MAELRVELPSVVALLGPAEACDLVEAPTGASLLRVGPREVLLVGDVETLAVGEAADPGCVVDDVSDAWISLVLEGSDAGDAFAMLSELRLPDGGWVQGEVASTAAKVLVAPGRLTILVPAMLAEHVEERIRIDAAEVLAS